MLLAFIIRLSSTDRLRTTVSYRKQQQPPHDHHSFTPSPVIVLVGLMLLEVAILQMHHFLHMRPFVYVRFATRCRIYNSLHTTARFKPVGGVCRQQDTFIPDINLDYIFMPSNFVCFHQHKVRRAKSTGGGDVASLITLSSSKSNKRFFSMPLVLLNVFGCSAIHSLLKTASPSTSLTFSLFLSFLKLWMILLFFSVCWF